VEDYLYFSSPMLGSKNTLVSHFLPLHSSPFIQILFLFFIFLIFLYFDVLKKAMLMLTRWEKINDFENNTLKAERVKNKLKF
jgi:hypothetical protein